MEHEFGETNLVALGEMLEHEFGETNLFALSEMLEHEVGETNLVALSPNKAGLFRIATESEISSHMEAFETLMGLEISDPSRISPETLCHYKKVSSPNKLSKRDNIINAMVLHLNQLESQKALPPKRRSKSFRNQYNRRLNLFGGILTDDSILHNLLSLNDQYKLMSKRIRIRRDFLSPFGDSIDNSCFILHTHGPKSTGGGRTQFGSAIECMSAMRYYISNSVAWCDVIEEEVFDDSEDFGAMNISVRGNSYKLVLRISFAGTDYWELSNSSRLRHILCGGNPPPVVGRTPMISQSNPQFAKLYPVYSEYLELVQKQILQIIRNSDQNPDCKFTIIQCCRTSPVCTKANACLKPIRGISKRLVCGDCEIDLCAAGCGRIYHGESFCTISFDEASQELINQISKQCPNPRCRVRIEKSDGCNHMTCVTCRTEFCWICNMELPRDEHGRYSTFMHYRPTQFGIGVENGCPQFNY